MTNITEKTAPSVSVGADTEQSSPKNSTTIIPTEEENFKGFGGFHQKMSKIMNSSYLNTISMTELYDTVYQSKPPLIDGLLYPGTYIFAGAPKLGKSFLMAQFAYHVSTGTPLWDYATRKGTVLYLALEDDYRRLQERLYRMFGTESTGNLHFSVSANQIGKGLDKQLQGFVTEHTDTNLIIIDTLQKVREASGDKCSYAGDYDTINRIKKITDRHDICILIVHHTRKQNADDKFDMISGTTALLGAADGGFILQKEKRTSNKATLDVSGRDQPDLLFHLIRNEEQLVWDLEEMETELWKEKPDPLLESVAEKITADNPDWEGSASEFVALLGVDLKPNTLSMKLNVNASRLLNDYNILYSSSRSHAGRKLSFHLQRDGRVDGDDDLGGV